MSKRFTRRRFVKGTAAAAPLVLLPALSRNVMGANEKINCAAIGAGGKGSSDIGKCSSAGENIVALCDVDQNRAAAFKKFPDAQKFDDFRKMLDKAHKGIDAITISTPDHCHAIAAAASIQLGKHVYVQKPLTHTVYEARLLRQLARKHKVCTQMGNQGSSLDSLRSGIEIVQSGGIGDVSEVHVWSNRPVWPQGASAMKKVAEGEKKLAEKPEGERTPKTLNWDAWLGPAAERPYNPAYLPFNWRGFWDFGTGALGDMACHTMNLPFWALELQYPSSFQAKVPKVYSITPPEWSVIQFEFPKRKVVKTGKELAPVSLTWYDGTRTGLPKEERTFETKLKALGINRPNGSGSLFIGSRGALYAPGDYGHSISLLPKEDFNEYKAPEAWLPRRGGGNFDQHQTNEWLEAIHNNKPDHAFSNFEYAAYFTEIILLGNLAMRVPGEKVKWDGKAMKSPNVAEANQYVNMEYRKGWELAAQLA